MTRFWGFVCKLSTFFSSKLSICCFNWATLPPVTKFGQIADAGLDWPEESGWEREEAPSSFHHYFVSIMFSNADKKLTPGSQSRLQHVGWDYKLPLPGQWSGNFRLIWWDIIIIINGMVNRRQSWEIPFVSPALLISVWYIVSGDTIHTNILIGWQLKCNLSFWNRLNAFCSIKYFVVRVGFISLF